MFSFGFYNSFDMDRKYNAVQISKIFDGIIRDGVYATIGECMMVKSSPDANKVIVGPGRAWFDHTWNENDSNMIMVANPSEITYKRIDAVVLDIRSEPVKDSRINKIMWVKGMPGNTPVKPTMIQETYHKQYPLAFVTRHPNVSVISQSDIENAVGTNACPFVTGILQTVSIENLLIQWRSQWDNLLKEYTAKSANWEEEAKKQINSIVNEFKKMADDADEELKAQINNYLKSAEKEFNAWFNNLKTKLDGDSLGHMQNQIEEITEMEFKHSHDLFEQEVTVNTKNGTITAVYEDGTAQTSITKSDQTTKILTILTMNTGFFNYRKEVTISYESGISKILTKYYKVAKT